MKRGVREWKRNVLFCTSSALLLAALGFAVAHQTRQLAAGEKTKVIGAILSRDGDLIRVLDNKSGEVVVVNINDDTQVELKQNSVPFFRHADMNVTAMVPGLSIQAEGLGNSKGQLEATMIVFTPDAIAVEAAPDHQLAANILNQRVSELDDYKNEFEVDVFFAKDSAVLDETAIRDLANLADIAKSVSAYMIEIAGYASNTLTAEADRKLSEERAAAVARYFREQKNIPMRRILVPVGYGSKQPVASNRDPQGRELNRRVDIKVLVNKRPGQGL